MKQMEFDMDVEIQVPPRPKIDRGMIESAAKNIVSDNEIFEPFGDDAYDDIANQYSYPSDGYETAKRLDDYYCWDMTLEIAENLDCMDTLVQAELQKAEREWAKEFNIKPELPVGTKIQEGTIEGICDNMAARYMVRRYGETNETRFLLVKFEDAVTDV